MKFERLRLTGFKSFVDPTELPLSAGLTGVVGPNGCGKSNLLEALRWVMGESSAKTMRGGAMDDVIFAGAASRSAKSFAEVSLLLDNSERLAPTAFNDFDQLEVARRITRDVGSSYRVNGKEARARDVRTLFADAATGARSPALVRQGRIGELIAAKPVARRAFLEDAAGVTGLHTRRREAELRLDAARSNLERVDDVLARLDTQVRSLRRQAAQAEEYREITTAIEDAQARLVWARFRAAEVAALEAKSALDEATRTVAATQTASSATERARDDAAQALPKLREEDGIARAIRERTALKRDGMKAAIAEAEASVGRLKHALKRAQDDLTREERLANDASGATGRLEAERETLEAEILAAPPLAEAEANAADALQQLDAGQRDVDALATRAAEASAGRKLAETTLATAQAEAAKTTSRHEALNARIEQIAASIETAIEAETAAKRVRAEAETAAETARNAAESARADRARADAALTDARETLAPLDGKLRSLKGEVDALEQALARDRAATPQTALISEVRAQPGYEAAIAVALGADAQAGAAEAFAPHAQGWRRLEPLSSNGLPGKPLSQFVSAPAALMRRLSQAQIVAREDGFAAQTTLDAGAILVSREGDLWRWDGYFRGAEAAGDDGTAARLARVNRAETLRQERDALAAAVAETRAMSERSEAEAKTARTAESTASDALRRAEDTLARTRRTEADASAAKARTDSQRISLSDDLTEATNARANAEAALDAARNALAETAPPDDIIAQLTAQRAALTALRDAERAARAAVDDGKRAAERRSRRLTDIGRELGDWARRVSESTDRVTEMTKRCTDLEARLADAVPKPAILIADAQGIAAQMTEAEARLATATEALAAAESNAARTAQEAREADTALASAREARARVEALAESAFQRRDEAALPLSQDYAGQDLAAQFADEAPVDVETVESHLSTLRADRERLGAVNLRAAIEIKQAQTERETLATEKEELEAAIEKLRKGLNALNREGRERLLAAFAKVNEKFSDLFTTLFNGGEARLELVDSDDPLEAGLEIMCQPPGKRLQSLMLLSGGEQTLTAMAMIFAAFLVNPAPVCVLDEVDAPLDDANVQRLCRLLREMTERTDARFLIITHHALTMASMDKLFGVTMSERGVSRLVSVDLQHARALRDAASTP